MGLTSRAGTTFPLQDGGRRKPARRKTGDTYSETKRALNEMNSSLQGRRRARSCFNLFLDGIHSKQVCQPRRGGVHGEDAARQSARAGRRPRADLRAGPDAPRGLHFNGSFVVCVWPARRPPPPRARPPPRATPGLPRRRDGRSRPRADPRAGPDLPRGLVNIWTCIKRVHPARPPARLAEPRGDP